VLHCGTHSYTHACSAAHRCFNRPAIAKSRVVSLPQASGWAHLFSACAAADRGTAAPGGSECQRLASYEQQAYIPAQSSAAGAPAQYGHVHIHLRCISIVLFVFNWQPAAIPSTINPPSMHQLDMYMMGRESSLFAPCMQTLFSQCGMGAY
jgi:hypothetical protein